MEKPAMTSQFTFTSEETLFARNLVDEFKYSNAAVIRQLILDMAISRRFAHDDDDISFSELARKMIKRRLALHQAKAFEGISKTIH